MLRWKPSSIPNYAEQTKIVYIVEKREPPNTDWNRMGFDIEETTFQVSLWGTTFLYYNGFLHNKLVTYVSVTFNKKLQ